jgi:hypothetical protein
MMYVTVDGALAGVVAVADRFARRLARRSSGCSVLAST